MNTLLFYWLLLVLGFSGFCENVTEESTTNPPNFNIPNTEKCTTDPPDNPNIHHQSSLVKDSISNISNDNNIFETLFDASIYDYIYYLGDDVSRPINLIVNDTILNNFTVNYDEEIVYYDIHAEQVNDSRKRNEFTYDFEDTVGAVIRIKMNCVLLIKGSFQVKKNTTQDVYGNFSVKLENPTFELTLKNDTIKQQYEHMQFGLTDEQRHLSVVRGLEIFIEKIQSYSHESFGRKIQQFKDAFTFVNKLLSSKLNENHKADRLEEVGGKPVTKIGVGPLLIQGLDNVKCLKIEFFVEWKPHSSRLYYKLAVTTGKLHGKYDWYFRFTKNEENRKTYSFSIPSLTITSGPYDIWEYDRYLPWSLNEQVGYVVVTMGKIDSYSMDSNTDTSRAVLSQILDRKLPQYLKSLLDLSVDRIRHRIRW